MKNRAVIISGGSLELEVVKEQIKENDFIIGVDRGLEFLDRNHITPDYLVGDFDSVDKEVIKKYKAETKIPIREYNPVKDASDTEIAVRLAMKLGYKHLIILGATGNRIDHVWANIQVLSIPYQEGIKAEITDRIHRIYLLDKNVTMLKKDAYGPYFSVFSLGKPVEGLTIKGAKYSLEDYELLPHDSLSVSNQFEEANLEITYREGILIFMESREA